MMAKLEYLIGFTLLRESITTMRSDMLKVLELILYKLVLKSSNRPSQTIITPEKKFRRLELNHFRNGRQQDLICLIVMRRLSNLLLWIQMESTGPLKNLPADAQQVILKVLLKTSTLTTLGPALTLKDGYMMLMVSKPLTLLLLRAIHTMSL